MYEILVFLESLEYHHLALEKVLTALSEANLKLKPSKCKFYKDEVSFLGNVILRDGHEVWPNKRKAIRD